MSKVRQVKYEQLRGPRQMYHGVPIGSGEVINLNSGRFVNNDASGRAEIAGAGDTLLWGWLEAQRGAITAAMNTSEGLYSGNINASCDAVYRIPVDTGTYVIGMRNEVCDLAVSSGIQGAQLSLSTEDVIIILGGDETGNYWVDVSMNRAKQTSFTGTID